MGSVSNTQEKTFDLSYHSSKKKSIGSDEVSLRFKKKEELENAGFVLGSTYSLLQNHAGEYFVVRSKNGRKEKDPGPHATGWAFSIDQTFEKEHPIGRYSYEIVDNLGDKAIKLGSPIKTYCEETEKAKAEPVCETVAPITNVFLFDSDAFYIEADKMLIPWTNIHHLKRNPKTIGVFTMDGKHYKASIPPVFYTQELKEIKSC